MILTFLLGLAAAILAPVAEPHVRRLLAEAGELDRRLSAVDLRMAAFAGCLLVAAILAALIGSGSGIALALGALIGATLPKFLGF